MTYATHAPSLAHAHTHVRHARVHVSYNLPLSFCYPPTHRSFTARLLVCFFHFLISYFPAFHALLLAHFCYSTVASWCFWDVVLGRRHARMLILYPCSAYVPTSISTSYTTRGLQVFKLLLTRLRRKPPLPHPQKRAPLPAQMATVMQLPLWMMPVMVAVILGAFHPYFLSLPPPPPPLCCI